MLKGLEVNLVVPDLWQQQAVRALQAGQDVVVQAPTGSGKTYIFELLYPSLKGQAISPSHACPRKRQARRVARARLGCRYRDWRSGVEPQCEGDRRDAGDAARAVSARRRAEAARRR
jgi:hypothetical protein